MRVSISSISVLIVAGLLASLAGPLSAPVFAAQSVSVKRLSAVAVPEQIEQLAGELAVAPNELAELATDGALPEEWVAILRNAYGLADGIAYGLGMNAGQRMEFAGQITNTLVRIEREARMPHKVSFAELVATVRGDASQTIRANLGGNAATAAASLLQEITPLREYP